MFPGLARVSGSTRAPFPALSVALFYKRGIMGTFLVFSLTTLVLAGVFHFSVVTLHSFFCCCTAFFLLLSFFDPFFLQPHVDAGRGTNKMATSNKNLSNYLNDKIFVCQDHMHILIIIFSDLFPMKFCKSDNQRQSIKPVYHL